MKEMNNLLIGGKYVLGGKLDTRVKLYKFFYLAFLSGTILTKLICCQQILEISSKSVFDFLVKSVWRLGSTKFKITK